MAGPKIVEVVGSLAVGGAERVALEVAVGIGSRGFTPHLVCAGDASGPKTPYEEDLKREAEGRGVTVSYVRFPGALQREAWAGFASFLRREKPALVHIHNRPQDWQMAWICSAMRVPVITSVHLTYPPNNWKVRALYAATHRLCPAVVCVSNAVADVAVEFEHLQRSRISVIYNGIREDVFADMPDSVRGEVRAELGVEGDEYLFFAAARLNVQKGHEFLIRGFARLPADVRAKLFIAGEGPLHAELAGLIESLGQGHRIRLLGPRRDVPRLLRAADAYASASLQEGHPLAILEAMGVGLPVVAPRLPTVTEIQESGTPLFYGPDTGNAPTGHDPVLIEKALAAMVERRDTFRKDAQLARDIVKNKFSLEAMSDEHARLYRRLLKLG